MFKKLRDKVALSGIVVLIIGVALLIFTFVSAYGFLTQSLSIIGSADIAKAFGEALPSLIAAGIHVMYLGILVWIGSLLTIRGITIIEHLPETPTPTPITEKPQRKLQPEPQKPETEKQPTQPEKQPTEPTKPEPKPEPQIMVIPPGETHEIASAQNPPEKKESQTTS
jgi:hypothetical protein